jgi:putative acetyltransferase
MLTIAAADLAADDVRDLLALHLSGMHASSPPGHVFALDLSGLQTPDVTVWTARIGGTLAAIAALRDLGDGNGELKSMRTHPDHLRKGVAAALLEHAIGEAQARGYRRLCLETGSGAAFEPALALYRRRGFVEGDPFGGYLPTEFNRLLHLAL